MTEIALAFKKIVASAEIDVVFDKNVLSISTANLGDEYYYACYLIVNDDTVKKCSYQSKTNFIFDLSDYSIINDINVRYYIYDKKNNQRSAKTIDITKSRLRYWVLAPEESKFTNSEFKALGEGLIKQNKLQLGPFPQYLISDDFSFWEKDPFNNRSWQWRVHWFEFIIQLLSYYQGTKDNAALVFAQKSIESWWGKYWGKKTSFEFIRHDHATALRAEVLLVFYCYVYEEAPGYFLKHKIFFERLEQFLHELLDQLLEDGFYSKHTNHGLEQARVLLLLGVFYKNINAQQIAVERISSELEFSFTAEGVHKENSPGYHQFVLKVFLSIISRFPKDILGELSQQFDEIGEKALEFIAHILRPDANLPIIGDTELLSATDSYSDYFGRSDAYQWYLYASSKGRKGTAPTETCKVYPKSGYAIYRTKWEEHSKFNQVAQLVLKAGCLSRYHHQQDESNILLYAYGEDWLIDSGLYNYINSDVIRQYMRKRAAHNIPLIIGADYNHSDFSSRLKWSLEEIEDNSETWSIITINEVLNNVRHQRVLTVFKDKEFENFNVEDQICCLDQNSREIQLQWHFPIDKEVFIQDGSVYVRSKQSDRVLRVYCSDMPVDIILSKGQKNGRVYGLYSPKMGVVEDAQVVKFIFNASHDFHVVTKFSFEIR